jgi:hypothetical protein
MHGDDDENGWRRPADRDSREISLAPPRYSHGP